MNRSFRSIWSDRTGNFVAVSEHAGSAGQRTSSSVSAAGNAPRFTLQAMAMSALLALGVNAWAQPTGGVVAAGAATIQTGANNTTIQQSTANVVINWQGFNIGAGQSVQFVQPSSSSVALNRVLGADPSSILGNLSANGRVFLVNPNGILFGKGSVVNVGGLVASSLNIADADFMAGSSKFSGVGGSVLNQGAIHADGGHVVLLGAQVGNDGVISARLGAVTLAAGNAVTLDVAGDGLLNVSVNQGAVDALVQNGGLIQADGGRVLLTAQSAGSLLHSAVNNTGVVRAQTLVTGADGSIMLMGDMQSGTVNVGGTLDASAPNGGNGGFIETSAAHVKVHNARITTLASAGKTGNWLIDPMDYTVAVAGGDITGVQLGADLESTNVTIQSIAGTSGTLGNVNVNAAVTWTAPTTLTLEAVNDVNINAAITGTNGSLVARAGNDVNVAAAAKTTTGNLGFTAANNVNISAATTIGTGNLSAVAGNNVTVSAASTITTGDMIFRADNDGTGPGAAAGTVSITCGANCLTITTGNLSIRFNPASYATTDAEILAYDAVLTGAGVLDAKAWVFGRGDNKLYDNTTTANVSGLKPDVGGVAPGVVLGTVSNANFDTEHVGTQKPITFQTTFSDPRHALFAPVGFAPGTYLTRADILVRPLSVNAVTDERVYNGSTSSVGVPTVIDLQPGDALNGTLTQNFASKNVMGPGGSTLVANGPYTVADGNGGNNYTVTVNTAPGTITPLALVGSITAANKVYDANDSATITGRALTTPVTGDDVSYIGGAARFSDQNVANGKDVTGTGLSLAGADAANYTVNSTALTTANITPAPLTITANDATKRYGETVTLAATAFTNTPLVGGETVGSVTEVSAGTVAGAGVAGSPYPIIPSDARGGTFLPSNYTINYVNGALTVTPAPLALTTNDATKVFGTVFTPGSTAFTQAGLVNGDTVTNVSSTSTGSPENASVAGSTYPIAITPGSAIGTFTPTNYAITYEAGALTVTPVVVPPVGPPVIVVPPVEPPIVVVPPVEPPVVVVPPVEPPLVAVPPVEPPIVVVPPVEPPIVVVPPVEPEVPPDVVTPPDAAMPPELPYEGPVVPPRVRVPTWVPVVTPPLLPPQLTSVPVPVPTPVPAPVHVPVPEVEVPPLVVVPQVPVAQPPVYVAPVRKPKPERN